MLAIADQPVEPSAYASASNSASAVVTSTSRPPSSRRHHAPRTARRRPSPARPPGVVVVAASAASASASMTGAIPRGAVDDLVVDESSHGRERTDRQRARAPARPAPAAPGPPTTSSTTASTPTTTPSDDQRDPAEVGVVGGRDQHGPLPGHGAHRLGSLPSGSSTRAVTRSPVERRRGDPLLHPGDVDPFVREVRHELLIVGDPEVELPEVDAPRSTFHVVENVDASRVGREPRSGPVGAVELAHDRARPAPAGRTAW